MLLNFSFADIDISCQICGFPVEVDETACAFLSSPPVPPPPTYVTEEMPSELLQEYERLKYSGGYELLRGAGGLFHLNHWAKLRSAFGFRLEELPSQTTVYYDPRLRDQQRMSASYYLSVIGLHHKLLLHNAMILHASYIEDHGRGILFMGPSGIGKSTQARLWEEYAHSRILNGDRALLRKKGDRWFAYGYPCCGSSGICINETLPLDGIVILEQDTRNHIEPMSAYGKILALTTGAQFFPWNPWEVDKVFLLSEELTQDIPMIKLHCRPEEAAVRVLQDFMHSQRSSEIK